jgi:hypothetical protein
MTPEPVAPQQRAKKSSKGCLTALMIVAGLALVVCLSGGVFLWRAAQNPEFQKVMGAVGQGAKLMIKGTKAPGTDALRAAGCDQALALSLDEMMAVVAGLVDAGAPADQLSGVAVVCQVRTAVGAPSCAALAKAYAAASKAAQPFSLSVRTSGDSTPLCEKTYGTDGEELAR